MRTQPEAIGGNSVGNAGESYFARLALRDLKGWSSPEAVTVFGKKDNTTMR